MTYESNRIATLDPLETDLPRTDQPGLSQAVLPEPFREWTETTTDYPRDKSVAQLFEEVAAEHPNAVAVVSGGRQLTYDELNTRANRLAHRLRRMGVRAETMVGCCIERSPELISALIAVLKAGGAYVPLDPAYPKERFDLLLEETRISVVLTQRSLASTVLAGRDLFSLFVDEMHTNVVAIGRSEPRARRRPEKSRVRDVHLGIYGQAEGRINREPCNRASGAKYQLLPVRSRTSPASLCPDFLRCFDL